MQLRGFLQAQYFCEQGLAAEATDIEHMSLGSTALCNEIRSLPETGTLVDFGESGKL